VDVSDVPEGFGVRESQLVDLDSIRINLRKKVSIKRKPRPEFGPEGETAYPGE
jgi:hypothetical protein